MAVAVADQPATVPNRTGTRFHPASLDALNFLLSDVRGALGPYLNVFLVTNQHWTQASVGLVTMISGWLGLAVQPAVGAAIDATRAKRALINIALFVLAVGASAIFLLPSFWVVMIANSAISIVGDIFGPAVAAITLGVYRQAQLARRMGRNAAFDHAGNVAIAAVAGAIGWAVSQRAVFLLVPIFAVMASVAVISIPAGAIDHERARGAEPVEGLQGEKLSGFSVLLTCRPLLHHRSTGHHAAHRTPGRAHGGHLGPKTHPPGRFRHPTDPGRALFAVRRPSMAHWGTVA
jgi:hypothetical protein